MNRSALVSMAVDDERQTLVWHLRYIPFME